MIGMVLLHSGENTRLIMKKISRPKFKAKFTEFEETTLSEWIIKSILNHCVEDKQADTHNLILTGHKVVDMLLNPTKKL